MKIRIDDLTSNKVADFLAEHIEDMQTASPPESKHALDLEGLRNSNITFWSVWENNNIVACGALKELNKHHGELKSMRTSKEVRRSGVATRLLEHILQEAHQRQYTKVSLETGSMPFFKAAHRFYEKFGFEECPPFAEYTEDINSLFMTKNL